MKMMKMTWMTRMINGTWGDEEDENDEYMDDELSMMKKMTNPTEPVNLRIERSPPPRLHLHTQGTQPAKVDNNGNNDPLIATDI